MLSKKQKKLLAETIQRQKAESNILPEEDKLFREESPSPGLHKHDDNNPFGVHRHNLGDPLDGAHVHTKQNPGGEHVHGLKEGMALIDGAHTHGHDGLGWHNHEHNDKDNFGNIPIEKPGQVLPPNPTDVKEE